MSKSKKCLMYVLCALMLDDACRYIKAIFMNRYGAYKHFSFIYTTYENGNVYNIGLIAFIIITVIYFVTHFFEPEND